ncbi:MAG: beta strand repeat-containing protein, partial [Rhodospirillales bacterium]
RSILIDANITTGNGALSLIANDPGAVAGQRDEGPGGITMAAGTAIDTGTGAFTATAAGSGEVGPITLRDVTAGSFNVSTLGTPITLAGPVTLSAGGSIAGGSIAVNGPLTRAGTAAGIGLSLYSTGDLTIDAPISYGGSTPDSDLVVLSFGAGGTATISATVSNAVSGGFVAVNGPGTLTVASGASISAGNGSISLGVDDLELFGTLSGQNTVRITAYTNGRPIRLGLDAGLTTLSVDADEIGRIGGTGTLVVGDNMSTGTIWIGGTVAFPRPVTIGHESFGSALAIEDGAAITLLGGSNLFRAGGTLTQGTGSTIHAAGQSVRFEAGALSFANPGGIVADTVALGAAGNATIGINATGDLAIDDGLINAFTGAGTLAVGNGGSGAAIAVGSAAFTRPVLIGNLGEGATTSVMPGANVVFGAGGGFVAGPSGQIVIPSTASVTAPGQTVSLSAYDFSQIEPSVVTANAVAILTPNPSDDIGIGAPSDMSPAVVLSPSFLNGFSGANAVGVGHGANGTGTVRIGNDGSVTLARPVVLGSFGTGASVVIEAGTTLYLQQGGALQSGPGGGIAIPATAAVVVSQAGGTLGLRGYDG